MTSVNLKLLLINEQVGSDIASTWIKSELRQHGKCFVKVEKDPSQKSFLSDKPIAGYVVTLEGRGVHGAFSALLRPVTESNEPSSLLWVIDFTAQENPHFVCVAKEMNPGFDERFLPRTFINSPASKIRISRSSGQGEVDSSSSILGLDVDFEWKTQILPSDDEFSQALGLEIGAKVLDELTRAHPLGLSDPWRKHVFQSPHIEIQRRN